MDVLDRRACAAKFAACYNAFACRRHEHDTAFTALGNAHTGAASEASSNTHRRRDRIVSVSGQQPELQGPELFGDQAETRGGQASDDDAALDHRHGYTGSTG